MVIFGVLVFFIIHIIRSGSDRLRFLRFPNGFGALFFEMAYALRESPWTYCSTTAVLPWIESQKKYPRWDRLKTRTSGPRHSILHYRWRKRRLINRIHSLGLICAAFDSHFDFTFFSVPRGSHRSHRPRLRSYSCRGRRAVSSVKLRSILRAVYIFNLSLFVLVRGRRFLTTEMGLYDGVSCIAFSG